jgi:hypothetical protein
MQKIVDIKILKVVWAPATQSEIVNHFKLKPTDVSGTDTLKYGITVGMDIASTLIETQIKDYLAKGWQMKGEINYVSFDSSHYITQTMVKYEIPTLENDLFSQ